MEKDPKNHDHQLNLHLKVYYFYCRFLIDKTKFSFIEIAMLKANTKFTEKGKI